MRARDLIREVDIVGDIGAKGEPGIASFKMDDAVDAMAHSRPRHTWQINAQNELRQYDLEDGIRPLFVLVDPQTQKPTMVIDTVANGAAHQVDTLYARGNTIPAHKVYAFMIKQLDILLMSSSAQSYAGAAVWRKLSAEPGITVFGWDLEQQKAINLGDNIDDDSSTDVYRDRDSGTQYHSDDTVVLVATKE